MGMLGTVLGVIGGLVSLIFWIKILITAFKTSVGWGIASLLIPFVILVFVIKNWAATKSDFLASLGGAVLAMIGMGLSMFGMMSSAAVQ